MILFKRTHAIVLAICIAVLAACGGGHGAVYKNVYTDDND